MKKYSAVLPVIAVFALMVASCGKTHDNASPTDAQAAEAAETEMGEVVEDYTEPEASIDEEAMKQAALSLFKAKTITQESQALSEIYKRSHPDYKLLSATGIGGEEAIVAGTVKAQVVDAPKGRVKVTAKVEFPSEDYESIIQTSRAWYVTLIRENGAYKISQISDTGF